MQIAKTLKALSRLLSYPDERTIDTAELLYIVFQGELPDAAGSIAEFGKYAESHELYELEEAFTGTFDVNPACALEVGWHLFGEEYARGMFLVRMREELRKYGIPENGELPDHITHVLAVVAAMPMEESTRFVRACVLPAVEKMRQALNGKDTPYAPAVSCLAGVLEHVWGSIDWEAEKNSAAASRHRPEGVDLLHAYPVADAIPGCTGGCGGPIELVQLTAQDHSGRSTPR